MIIYCFLCLDLNAKKARNYLKENKNINISLRTLLKVYSELRDVIYNYMKLLYESETISIKNNRDYFSVDESLINHKNKRQLWLIGIIILQKNFVLKLHLIEMLLYYQNLYINMLKFGIPLFLMDGRGTTF